MTKLKPTYCLSTQEQKSDKLPQHTAVDSSRQASQERLLRMPQLSPDISADMYDNDLRTVHTTSVDGEKRLHMYRARAPVESVNGIPSVMAHKSTTPTLESHDEAEQVDDWLKLLYADLSVAVVPSNGPMTMAQVHGGNEYCTRSATPILETRIPTVPPALPDFDRADEKCVVPQRRFEEALYQWLAALKTLCVALAPFTLKGACHMIVAFLLRLTLPRTLWHFLIVPWTVYKGTKTVARASKMRIPGSALFVLVLGLSYRMIPDSVMPWALRGVIELAIQMVSWLLFVMLAFVCAWVMAVMFFR